MATNTVFNVTEDTSYGALTLGTRASPTDITDALQEAVNEATPATGSGSHNAEIYIPPGFWEISSTITSPYREGFTLLGGGIARDVNDTYRGVGTVLQWAGAAGGTMFELRGAQCRVGNFTIDGANLADIGILIDRDAGSSGLATGHMVFLPLYLENCTYGIQFEETLSTSANCDNCMFDFVTARSCTAALRFNGANAMDHRIRHLVLYDTDYGLQVNGGGMITVEGGLLAEAATGGTTLLYIPSGAATGQNNGIFFLNNFKVDSSTGSNFTLVDSQHSSTIRIFASGIMLSPDDYDGTFAHLTGRNYLSLRNSSGTFKSISGTVGISQTPTCHLDSCYCEVPPEEIFSGTLRVKWSNLIDATDMSFIVDSPRHGFLANTWR